jgi:hypothetical protein
MMIQNWPYLRLSMLSCTAACFLDLRSQSAVRRRYQCLPVHCSCRRSIHDVVKRDCKRFAASQDRDVDGAEGKENGKISG